MSAFSLLSSPWLPAIHASGERKLIRPAAIAAADDPAIAFAWSRPDFDAAAREFMIGLLSIAAWERILKGRAWQAWWHYPPDIAALDVCLAPFADAFVLDGDGPRFLQDQEELEGAATAGVGALMIDSPGANTLKKNADLFVKRGRIEILSRPAAAMALLTLQAFAPSGGAGHRTSLRGGGPMTTLILPQGEAEAQPTLWQQLWLNVHWERDWEDPRTATKPLFPWCAPTRISDSKRNTTPDHVHPAQLYFGMPRRIRLEFEPNTAGTPCDLTGMVDEVVVRNYRTRPYGHNYEGWSGAHPLTPSYRLTPTDAEWLPVHPQPGRLGYRDWLGLVIGDQDQPDQTVRAPAAIVSVAAKRISNMDRTGRPRLLASGYDMDNMKARGFVESEMPLLLPPEEVRAAVERQIRRLVRGAREVEANLSRAVGRALAGGELPAADKGPRNQARNRFWADSEPAFLVLAASLTDRSASDAHGSEEEAAARTWLDRLRKIALAIFDEIVPLDQIEAGKMERIVAARRALAGSLHGYGKDGMKLYGTLSLPPPAPKKKERAA